MATSSTYTVSKTFLDICKAVMRVLNVLGVGKTPTAEDTSLIMEAANLWILQQNGPTNRLKPSEMVWTRERATLTLSTSSSTYELKPSGGDLDIQIPNEIISILYRDSDGYDTPMDKMTRKEYDEITDKDAEGTPGKWLYEKDLDAGNLYLDMVPDEAEYLYITYRQPLEVVTDSGETLDMEPYYFRYLKYAWAIEVAPEFGVSLARLQELGVQSRYEDAAYLVSTFSRDDEPFSMGVAR